MIHDHAIRRRAFLRATSAAAATVGLHWAGCASRQPQGSIAAIPQLDPETPWWLQQNFGPVFEELDVADLPVRGAIPPELDGVYLRNGSNAQGANNPHWFLGDGMVHGVRLSGGSASWYKNRYVRTPWYESDTPLGAPGGPNTQSNVSLVHHANRVLASGEVGFPYQLDPANLSTIGPYDFGGRLETFFTAHPAIDPATEFMHFFGYGFEEPLLTYCVADSEGTLVQCERIDARAPTMMHSFAVTDRDVIFWELPVVFDLDAFDSTGWFFRWDREVGARVGVMPLGGPASAIRWVEIEPCYVFHATNAFRDGDTIVVDVCRYDEMMNGARFGALPAQLRRWRIDTSGEQLSFSETTLSERNLEFPVCDRRLTGRPTRYAWLTEFRAHPETLDPGGIVRYDSRTGVVDRWDPGPHRQSGEPLFVPTASGEGEGWLLTFVYDLREDASDLVILDATSVAAGPVAAVRMPRRVPHGFHAVWVPA